VLVVRPPDRLTAGDSAFVPPWTVHGTLNLSDAPARLQIIGAPGAMTGYFIEAGVPVADEHASPITHPPGPRTRRDRRAMGHRVLERTRRHDTGCLSALVT
jgi:hypothetical protein